MVAALSHDRQQSLHLPIGRDLYFRAAGKSDGTRIQIENKTFGFIRNCRIERQISKKGNVKRLANYSIPTMLGARRASLEFRFIETTEPLYVHAGVDTEADILPGREVRILRIYGNRGPILGFQDGRALFVMAYKEKREGHKVFVRFSLPITLRYQIVDIGSHYPGVDQLEMEF